MRSSCTTPSPTTATRVSWGVTLIRISSTRRSQALEQLPGLVERQAHHARIAAAQLHHEARGASLDAVRAGLVVGLTRGHIEPDLLGAERLELDLGYRERALQLIEGLERYRGQYFVRLSGDLGEQFAPPRTARGEVNAALERAHHGAEYSSLNAMVRVPGEQRRAAVDLLEEQHLGERVRQGERGQPQEQRGVFPDRIVQPVGAADHEGGLVLEQRGELYG